MYRGAVAFPATAILIFIAGHSSFTFINPGRVALAASLFVRFMAAGAGAGIVVHAAIGDAILIVLVFFRLNALGRTVAAGNIERYTTAAHHAALFLFIVIIAAATPTAAATGHTRHAAAAIICIAGHVAASTFLSKFIKFCQTFRMPTRISNHAEQNLSLLHIRQIISQVFIIIAQLHFIINSNFKPLAEAFWFFNTNLANAIALTSQLTQNLLKQGIVPALVHAELAEHLFIHLTLGGVHHAAIEQLCLSGAQHHIFKNIFHAKRPIGTLTIVVKRNITTST